MVNELADGHPWHPECQATPLSRARQSRRRRWRWRGHHTNECRDYSGLVADVKEVSPNSVETIIVPDPVGFSSANDREACEACVTSGSTHGDRTTPRRRRRAKYDRFSLAMS